MKNKTLILALLFVFLFTACAGEETPTASAPVASAEPAATEPTPTLDPCSEAALPGEVEKINDLMREFDDYSRLASSILALSTPQEQLVQVIPSLQEVRRRAESQEVPVCLQELKNLQISHMNTVIEILMVFMGNPQAEVINPGIAQARDLHMKYDIEIARLLGLTMVAPPTSEAVVPIVPSATAVP